MSTQFANPAAEEANFYASLPQAEGLTAVELDAASQAVELEAASCFGTFGSVGTFGSGTGCLGSAGTAGTFGSMSMESAEQSV